MSEEHVFGRPARYPEPEPIDVTPPPRAPIAQRPKRLSRRQVTVLGAVATVALAGVVGVGAAGVRILEQKDAVLDTPSQVAGLTRDDSERAKDTADYLRTALAAEIDLDKSIGAVYADPADATHSVLLFGGTTLLWSPDKDLGTLFNLVSDDTGAVDGLHTVPAGALGGVMKCGTTTAPEGNIAVCGWADHGSVALGMFPGRSADDSASLLRRIREVVQTRK